MTLVLAVNGAGHSGARDPGAQVHYLVLLPPMLYIWYMALLRAIQPLEHLKLDLDSTYLVSFLPCLRHSVHLSHAKRACAVGSGHKGLISGQRSRGFRQTVLSLSSYSVITSINESIQSA